MGFMKFKKKKEENNDDALDIPPPPPMGGDSQQQNSPQNNENLLPPEQPANNFDIPPIGQGGQDNVSNLPPPNFGQEQNQAPKENLPGMEKPDTSQQQIKQKVPVTNKFPQERPKKEAPAAQPKSSVMPSGEHTFIEVNSYKDILKDLNNIKKSLKTSDDEIDKIIQSTEEEDKIFASIHSTLGDVEKKLVELEGSIQTD